MKLVALSDRDARRASSRNGIDRTLLVKLLSQIHDSFGAAPPVRHLPRNALRLVRQLPQILDTRFTPIRPAERHSLPGKLVVSLTSYPPRFATLGLTLRSLLLQDVQPDVLVLWVSVADRKQLPRSVTSLQQFGLVISECEDVKSYKKIIPALKAYPDAFIITADDDIRYPEVWLRRFVNEYRRPDEILCQCARRVVLTPDRRLTPYQSWHLIAGDDAGPTVFPIGLGGILYPPNTLSPETANAAEFMRLCPYADDVWLFWMGHRAGSVRRAIVPPERIRSWQRLTRSPNLWSKNKNGGNDTQIAAMTQAYGIPEALTTGRPPLHRAGLHSALAT